MFKQRKNIMNLTAAGQVGVAFWVARKLASQAWAIGDQTPSNALDLVPVLKDRVPCFWKAREFHRLPNQPV